MRVDRKPSCKHQAGYCIWCFISAISSLPVFSALLSRANLRHAGLPVVQYVYLIHGWSSVGLVHLVHHVFPRSLHVWCLGVFFKAVFCVHYASVWLHPRSASYSPPQCKKSHLTLTSSCSVHCCCYWRQQCLYIFSNVHFFPPSEFWLASRTCNFRVRWPLNGLYGWHGLTHCSETCTRLSLKHHWIPGISY